MKTKRDLKRTVRMLKQQIRMDTALFERAGFYVAHAASPQSQVYQDICERIFTNGNIDEV